MATLYGTGGRMSVRAAPSWAEPRADGVPAENVPTTKEKYEDYLAKVVKAIPTEVVSVYLLGKTIGPDYVMWWTLACWAIVFVLRKMATDGEGKNLNITLAMIAFPLWVMATGGSILGYAFPEQVTGLAVLAFSVLAGALYNNK